MTLLPDRRAEAVKATIRSVMDGRPALGRVGLLDKLEQLLEAERTVFATSEGRISDERSVPDNSARLRALNMALTLRDEFPARAGLAVGINIQMERLPDLTHLSLRELQMLSDEGEPGEPDMPGTNGHGSGAVAE